MSEAKDPAIKLLGKTIPVPEISNNRVGEERAAGKARIKKIMQADEDVGKISMAVPLLVSKAL